MNATLDTDEAATYLKISPNTLANWRCQKTGPVYYAPAGKIIYYKDDLDNWIKGTSDE